MDPRSQHRGIRMNTGKQLQGCKRNVFPAEGISQRWGGCPIRCRRARWPENPLLIPVPVPTQAIFSPSGKSHCSCGSVTSVCPLPSLPFLFSLSFFLLLASFYFLLPLSLYSLSFLLCPHTLFPWLEREGIENICSRSAFSWHAIIYAHQKIVASCFSIDDINFLTSHLLWTYISTKIRILKP